MKSCLKHLDSFKIPVHTSDRELLKAIARTSLRTKLSKKMADKVTDVVVDAVLSICDGSGKPIDLFMVEIIHLKHKLDSDSRLVRGLVLDHGSRHPKMPKCVEKCFILNCNISLELERSEVNSVFFYSNVIQREKMVMLERKLTDFKVRVIVELKRRICDTEDKSFVMVNQKGVDAFSLEMLAREGILALRRAKRRNSERLQLSCGGYFINSVKELSLECLGYAGFVSEYILGDQKYTFIEGVKYRHSVTILIKGSTDHAIYQIKDAVRDGLRSVKNVINDGFILQGGGTFEVSASLYLMNTTRQLVSGKIRLGIESFAQALLSLPKILAKNSGFDAQEVIICLIKEHEKGNKAGLDIFTGEPTNLSIIGIYDNYCVKKQILISAPVVASQLLLIDEIIRVRIN